MSLFIDVMFQSAGKPAWELLFLSVSNIVHKEGLDLKHQQRLKSAEDCSSMINHERIRLGNL
jgi:hypothetical protein